MSSQLALPLARTSDPQTSREAAERVRPGNSDLVKAIRAAVYDRSPISAFDIADKVVNAHLFRWDHSTVRTAVSRAGLRAYDTEGRSPRNQRCIRYVLGDAS